jgi:hypothetical protein
VRQVCAVTGVVSTLSVGESLVGQSILPQINAKAKRELSQQILRLLYSGSVIGLVRPPDLFVAEFSETFEDL